MISAFRAKGLAREYTGSVQEDRLQTQSFEAMGRLSRMALANGVLVMGEPSTGAFKGLTDGITFTTGQTKNVFHGLGREATGFLVVDARTSAHELYRVTTGIDATLAKTYIRLTHSGASTTVVKLLVF